MKFPGFLVRLLIFIVLVFRVQDIGAQPKDNTYISGLVKDFRTDIRGPYRDIRWFCSNGSTVGPHDQCPGTGAVQRARYKDNVIALGKSNHVFLGQILSTTPVEEFWDKENAQSRMKQYQMEKFLRGIDNGWISRKAQYYRGAYQVEDEEAWGIAFYNWLLKDEALLSSNFFLIRQSALDIPHAAGNNTTQNVRARSREISDAYPPFLDLRTKIHGQPDAGDVASVQQFLTKHQSKLTPELRSAFNSLIADMQTMYKPVEVNTFKSFVKKVPASSELNADFSAFIAQYGNTILSDERCKLIVPLAEKIRRDILTLSSPAARLAMLDASIKLEALLNRDAANWNPTTLYEQIEKVMLLVDAAAAFGYLSTWEWEKAKEHMEGNDDQQIRLQDLSALLDYGQRTVEWGSGMVRGTYQDVVKLYGGFEPLAYGFMDDRIRSSVLLQLGSSVTRLGNFYARQAGFSNLVMDIPEQSAIRGLNPGYAMGELMVANRASEEVNVSADKIYVFNRPPADLKPVAGIATVTEGNMVSHVQLLARNLGIPNAVLSAENLNALLPFNGRKVFYAVSNKGTVIMKPAEEMSDEEKSLFTKKARSEEKIRVPVEKIELTDVHVLNLRDIDATQSGIRCGPKAANLGQLKQLFPENVVEGLVIPFSVFRDHFNQLMPGKEVSYWDFLNGVFQHADAMRDDMIADSLTEAYILSQLSILREAILEMPLKPAFVEELTAKFSEILGMPLGKLPVFLRSDTNMEDLKDFTGAGLNLTLFNVLAAEKILKGIKEVWASPYTERSYRWRQHYLLNPENVFPSILIIPSVNADVSGVMITKGVTTGDEKDITIAFNRGVGGAVEGQAAESWLLKNDGTNLLLAPAREPEYTSIPETGGTVKVHTTFDDRLLSEKKLQDLRNLADLLLTRLPETGIRPPLDVELGFKDDHIWLFQVRPFAENKRAASSAYLSSITPQPDTEKIIMLNSAL